MNEHTPGPWRWLNQSTLVGDHGKRPVVMTVRGKGLGQRGQDGLLRKFDPQSPDGLLIQAAPDLLAACHAAVSCINEVLEEPTPTDWINIRAARNLLTAAVDKAKGVTEK